MRVFIASPLYAYTGGRGEVEAFGATVAEVLADLDRRFPGIRRRIVDEQDRVRQHMRIYVGTEPAATLDQPIPEGQDVHILQSLSGGTATPRPASRQAGPQATAGSSFLIQSLPVTTPRQCRVPHLHFIS